MSESYVNSDADSASGTVTLTVPTGVQGQDMLVLIACAATTAITTPSGWTLVDTESPTTGNTTCLYTKVAAGTVGSPSSDIGASVVVAPGSSVHTAASLIAYRGVSVTGAINASAFAPYNPSGGTTSFAGASVTTTVDGCDIVTAITDKNSVTIAFTPPAGYTTRASAVPTSGSGKTDCVIATKAGGSAGNYGMDTWTTTAMPGSVGVWTIALTPVSTTQTVRPTSDVSSSSATAVPAGAIWSTIDEGGSPDPSDYTELLASGNFIVGLATLTDPGVDTGFSVPYTVAFGTSTAGAVWAVSLYQSTTLIETWNHTQTVDNDSQSHALDPANIVNVVFSGSPAVASNLRLKFVLTSVS